MNEQMTRHSMGPLTPSHRTRDGFPVKDLYRSQRGELRGRGREGPVGRNRASIAVKLKRSRPRNTSTLK